MKLEIMPNEIWKESNCPDNTSQVAIEMMKVRRIGTIRLLPGPFLGKFLESVSRDLAFSGFLSSSECIPLNPPAGPVIVNLLELLNKFI